METDWVHFELIIAILCPEIISSKNVYIHNCPHPYFNKDGIALHLLIWVIFFLQEIQKFNPK